MVADVAVHPGLQAAGHQSSELTRFTVRGPLSPASLLAMFREFLARPTPCVLWDLREADVAHLSDDELRELVGQLIRLERVNRSYGRSAFVCSRDADCSAMRLLIAYAEANDYGIRLGLFRDIDDARCWLAEV